MNKRAQAIYTRAARLGLEVESNRPGDGTRRYTFTRPEGHTYHAVGAARAEAYLTGYDHANTDKYCLKAYPVRTPVDPCCDNEKRSMDGGCTNCGDPSL